MPSRSPEYSFLVNIEKICLKLNLKMNFELNYSFSGVSNGDGVDIFLKSVEWEVG